MGRRGSARSKRKQENSLPGIEPGRHRVTTRQTERYPTSFRGWVAYFVTKQELCVRYEIGRGRLIERFRR
jgi:hypothetical protein